MCVLWPALLHLHGGLAVTPTVVKRMLHDYVGMIATNGANSGAGNDRCEDALAVNEYVYQLHKSHAALLAACEACLKYIPGSEVHCWPPGFKLKDEALRLSRAAILQARKLVQP